MKHGEHVRVVAATTQRGRKFIGRIGRIGRLLKQGSNMVRVDFDDPSGSYTFADNEIKPHKQC